MNLLHQQYSVDLCQPSLSAPNDSYIQNDSSHVASCAATFPLGTFANTLSKYACNDIPYQRCKLSTVVGINQRTDYLGGKSKNDFEEGSSFTHSIVSSRNLQYQYLIESIAESSKNSQLNYDENNVVQEKFKNQIWNPYFDQIYGDAKNWMTVNQNNELHQSSFYVALFSHYEGNNIRGKSHCNSRIPMLITRFNVDLFNF